MSSRSQIATPEAVTLLEEAQCGTASEASSVLQKLCMCLRTPHPSVTSALHDLLQIFPLQTIPYLPSLIPATPSVVSLFVESFSDLLSADRTLLVPIIGALSELPLTASHVTQSRATLRYALSVVDAHDLPAVVRALARLCANSKNPSSARWAATVLRTALDSPPKTDVIPVLAHVFEDVCRPGNPVGAALRAQAGTRRVSWLDLVVWCHAVRACTGPYAIGYKQALTTLSTAIKGSLSNGDSESVVISVRAAGPALGGDPMGVKEFVRIVADEMSRLRLLSLAPIVNFMNLVQMLVREVPTAARGILQELLAPSRASSSAVEAALLGVVAVLPRDAKQMATASRNVRVKVAILSGDGGDTSIWSSAFVSIRKGLLFGVDEDRRRALTLAHEIIRVANAEVVGELLSIMDTSIPPELGDELAIGFLEIVTVATFRGMVTTEDASRMLEKRIEKECPRRMLREVLEPNDDASQSANSGTVHVDVGLIWEQDPGAIAVVVPAAIALSLMRRETKAPELISTELLNSLCLVPVLCIPLYSAVQDCTMEFDTALFSAKRSRGVRFSATDIPSNVRETNTRDLMTGISVFAAGMAAIVGILNASSLSQMACRRALISRRRRRGMEGGADGKALWSLVERLTEFDRMLNALLLGYEILQRKALTERRNCRERKPESTKIAGSDRSRANCALNKAHVIREAVLRGILTSTTSVIAKDDDLLGSTFNYPRLSLHAVIASLVAIPDEAGIETINDREVCTQTRDVELARIDKLLLRQLLGCMTVRTAERPVGRGKSGCEVSQPDLMDSTAQTVQQAESSEWLNRVQDALGDLGEPSLAIPCSEVDLDEHENVFIFDDDEFSDEEEEEEEEDIGPSAVRWASSNGDSETHATEYVRESVTAIRRKKLGISAENPNNVSEIIHSPFFAALLLDRAATYVAVARKGRRLRLEDSFLSNATNVAGFALGCLAALLRVLPFCPASDFERQSSGSNSVLVGMTNGREFLQKMDDFLITGVPVGTNDKFEDCFQGSEVHGRRSISALRWISENSIDAAVSALALEVLLIVSEFGCLHIGLTRYLILASLTTIYEYGADFLWSPDDVSLLFQESFGDWSLKRRTSRASESSILLNTTPEPSPWVSSLSKGPRRQRSVDRCRLHMFFEGMHIPNALLEACGWVREISAVMLKDPNSVDEGTAAQKSAVFHAESGTQPNKSESAEKHETSRCQTMLDVSGFRNVVATLMQVVQVGLHTLRLPESFDVDEALDATKSPVTQWKSALTLLCAILRLYRINRDSLLSGTEFEGDVGQSAIADHDFDYYIINAAASAMQLLRSRLGELYSWYSDATTDLSRLTDEVVDGFEKVIGGSALAVSHCLDISTSLKREYSSIASEVALASNGIYTTNQKSQGRTPSKRRAVREEELSRARKIIPRLSSQCDSVTKETQRLAKVMGFRARKALFKLAPAPLEEDQSLCFGVGLDLVDGEESPEEEVLVDESDAAMADADVDMTEGGEAKKTAESRNEAKAEIRPKPRTIRFR